MQATLKRIHSLLKRTATRALARARGPERHKGAQELKYWRACKSKEGTLSHSHYSHFYTTHFGLDGDFFKGKKILDIGCGPRGSLEWAYMAEERVGLDPLVDSYRELGIDEHKMRYVCSPAERIPFEDGHFDVVCSFNSLDHVNDLEQTIGEIKRIVAPGGLFLLLTDVNHDPTPCEPISFSWDIVKKFTPPMELVEEKHYEKSPGGMYKSIRVGAPYDHGNQSRRYGILSAMFRKR
ncbi:MAG: class I SAM-dependent methyltransferase [Candidatus Coatesbacteria bacterium]|nr:class I SAM-dependent methyltransferase [Candidatus Coatesbacteria bacterium]